MGGTLRNATARNTTAFLVLLMQRLVSSSTAAILRRWSDDRPYLGNRRTAHAVRRSGRGVGRADRRGAVRGARQCPGPGVGDRARRAQRPARRLPGTLRRPAPTPRLRAFFELLGELRSSSGTRTSRCSSSPSSFRPRTCCSSLLEDAGIAAVAINGSMGLAERRIAQQAFRETAQVLVSTDAGGEGINLQFAHVVVNWDLPWSPTRLEQRIGRVDRIGQTHTVRALQPGLRALRRGTGAARCSTRSSRSSSTNSAPTSAVTSSSPQADVPTSSGPLPSSPRTTWVEQQISSRQKPGSKRAKQVSWPISSTPPWSRGTRRNPERLAALVAAAADACRAMGRTITDPLEALNHLPEVAEGEPCPVVRLGGAANGWLSVWEVTPDGSTRSAVSVFQPDQGLVRPDLALTTWDRLCGRHGDCGPRTPEPVEWARINEDGVDHAYQAVAAAGGRSRSHLAGRPTTPAGPGDSVKQWVRDQIGRDLGRHAATIVLLDPEGLLTADDIEDFGASVRVLRAGNWLELRRVWDLDIRRSCDRSVALVVWSRMTSFGPPTIFRGTCSTKPSSVAARAVASSPAAAAHSFAAAPNWRDELAAAAGRLGSAEQDHRQRLRRHGPGHQHPSSTRSHGSDRTRRPHRNCGTYSPRSCSTTPAVDVARGEATSRRFSSRGLTGWSTEMPRRWRAFWAPLRVHWSHFSGWAC